MKIFKGLGEWIGEFNQYMHLANFRDFAAIG